MLFLRSLRARKYNYGVCWGSPWATNVSRVDVADSTSDPLDAAS